MADTINGDVNTVLLALLLEDFVTLGLGKCQPLLGTVLVFKTSPHYSEKHG